MSDDCCEGELDWEYIKESLNILYIREEHVTSVFLSSSSSYLHLTFYVTGLRPRVSSHGLKSVSIVDLYYYLPDGEAIYEE